MYADYSYYATEFFGNAIPADDFPRLASRASDYIDYYTRDKAAKATDPAVLTALSKACCALAERIYTDELQRAVQQQALAGGVNASAVKSETVGNYSISYTTAADFVGSSGSANPEQNAKNAYAAVAMQYLRNTGLLYRGCP